MDAFTLRDAHPKFLTVRHLLQAIVVAPFWSHIGHICSYFIWDSLELYCLSGPHWHQIHKRLTTWALLYLWSHKHPVSKHSGISSTNPSSSNWLCTDCEASRMEIFRASGGSRTKKLKTKSLYQSWKQPLTPWSNTFFSFHLSLQRHLYYPVIYVASISVSLQHVNN